jgi:hypothetical protein
LDEERVPDPSRRTKKSWSIRLSHYHSPGREDLEISTQMMEVIVDCMAYLASKMQSTDEVDVNELLI